MNATFDANRILKESYFELGTIFFLLFIFPQSLVLKKRHFSVVDADKLDTRFLLFSNGLLFCTLLTCVSFFSLVGAVFKKGGYSEFKSASSSKRVQV